MLEFQLFRVKAFHLAEGLPFPNRPTPSELLRSAIKSGPSKELRPGVTWRIGNVEELDENGVYFRFGKTTKAMLSEMKKQFRDVPQMDYSASKR